MRLTRTSKALGIVAAAAGVGLVVGLEAALLSSLLYRIEDWASWRPPRLP